jgi:hypothetical protein
MGFWRGRLVEPLADIAKTVRAGGEGIIVQKGSIDANLQVFIWHPEIPCVDLVYSH